MSVGDRGSKVESHVARLFKFEPPMCSVHHTADWARHALRLVQLAARQLTAVAQPLQGPVASARSCVPLRASYHHRNQPSLEPILPRATKRGCYCGMLVAASTDPRRAALARMTSLWPTLIRRPEVPCASEKGSDRPCTSSLARIGDTAQSVRASDTSNCRYQHPPAPWQTSSGKKRTPIVL